MNRYHLLLITIVLLWSTATAAQHTAAQTGMLETIAKRGQASLKADQYTDAQRMFSIGLERARSLDETDWTAKFMFYLGNTYLIEASADGSADQADEIALARKAVGTYRRVVKMRPESGSAKVNLARTYALTGQDRSADGWYRRAIAQNDGKQMQYRQQYAAFLEQRNPAKAIPQLRAVIEAQPKSEKVHRQLMQIYLQPKFVKGLPEYLEQQVKIGEVLRAQNAALEALLEPQVSSVVKDELMLVVAASLAGQSIIPADFAKSETAGTLRQIAEVQPSLSGSVNELLSTLNTGKSMEYHWWAQFDERASGMCGLLRSIARTYDQANQPELAKSLYQDAVELYGARDPNAVRALVDYHAKRGNLAEINEISSKYEYQLFAAKGQAYQAGDIDAIYDYHRTLASIYSYQASRTGKWGSTSKVNSAAFQLQHAYNTAARSGTITPDAKLVTNLAKTYEVKGDNTRANALRIDAAENYNREGKSIAAATVLKTVNISKLSNRGMRRYERIKTADLIKPKVKIKAADRPAIELIKTTNQLPGKDLQLKPATTQALKPITLQQVKPVTIQQIKPITAQQVKPITIQQVKPINSSNALNVKRDASQLKSAVEKDTTDGKD